MRGALLFTLLILCTYHARAAQSNITVVYSPTMDTVCSIIRGGTIKDEWKAELDARKPEFEALWAGVGPNLMHATEAITGKVFPSRSQTVYLTLCDLPSQSMLGISVNVRYALKSFTSPPVPMRYKVDILFHELLHVFLASHPIENSVLLGENASESECTRKHLHLLSLQKAVLLKLHQFEALNDVVTIDGELPNRCYERAWDIVNATDEEYLKYVAEVAR